MLCRSENSGAAADPAYGLKKQYKRAHIQIGEPHPLLYTALKALKAPPRAMQVHSIHHEEAMDGRGLAPGDVAFVVLK